MPVEDVVAALRLMPDAQRELDRAEARLIEALLDSGLPWDKVASAAYNGVSKQALEQRYRRIGGLRMGRPGPKRKLGADQLAIAGVAVAAGEPVDEVAAGLGVHPVTLRRNLGL